MIAVASDHGGFHLKALILEFLEKLGHEVNDLGTHSEEPADYPDYARKVGQEILSKKAKRGILICGSGVGACVAANKFPGIRAAICHDTFSAHQGVEDDDMNILCLGARVIGPELAKEIVQVWLSASFSGLERHCRRLGKVKKIEEECFSRRQKMNKNPLIGLKELGQSVWLDNLSKKLINSGELKRLIDEDGLSGVTSNPTIFQKAISGSPDYDGFLQRMIGQGIHDEKELFLGLAVEDISAAAGMLWPVYQQTGGRDGFVSIEVSPDLAYDTETTITEAKRLFSTIKRKNTLVKVPATKQGLPAIEQLISEGVNVNVTLLFSVKRYEEVAGAYLRGLERRVSQGLPINEIASVASFFVSRVDTLTDKLLEPRLPLATSKAERDKIATLLGKAAVANAKIAYQKYRDIFSDKRFLALKEKGGHIQRILWGSTGTKNPKYSDIKYVEELIGSDSINTMPEATMQAFKEHGRARITIDGHLDEARRLFQELKALGIEIDHVTEQLEGEGVNSFSDSFFSLLKEIAIKRDAFLFQTEAGQRRNP